MNSNSNNPKIQPTHWQRSAYVYVRQSSATQVLVNRESTDRQYRLCERAQALGWAQTQIKIIDEDLAHSGSGTVMRHGFTQLIQEVALGRVGLILCLEASRVARNNTEWYRLLDLCGVSDTLIGDEEGIYHPGLYNDRLLLGLKGTMAEAELHVLRARLDGGIRNKAKRGELRRGLPVGLIWGQAEGEVLFHPDQAVKGAIQSVFSKFAELGSARQVHLWFKSEEVLFPHESPNGQIQWLTPNYVAIHKVLRNPVYAGAYAYGKSRTQRYVDDTGHLRKRIKRLAREQWAVLIPDHHPGFIDWATFEMNQKRLARNTRPEPHQSAGVVREGSALLQGLASCGRCGRRLRVYYQGNHSTPGYYCANNQISNGRGTWCLRVGGVRIEQAVVESVLAAIAPAGLEAAFKAQELAGTQQDAVVKQLQLEVERAAYEAQRAQRRYQSVEPENRLVARSLEADWEKSMAEQRAAEEQLCRKQQERRLELTETQREQIRALGQDLKQVWSAPTTTDRDRKELLQSVVEEVKINVVSDEAKAQVAVRWKTSAVTELEVLWRSPRVAPIRTAEDTVELVRRLAVHHPDAVIAGVLNRQGKPTARGERFNADRVGNVRRAWKIPCYQAPEATPEGELVTVAGAAQELGVAVSTLHRWLMDGFIAGEQVTPGAPWRIRLSQELRGLFVREAPAGYVTMVEAMKELGVTRQTIMQRVKRGELAAVHVHRGKQKGLRIRVIDTQPQLFETKP
jgi:DNA invertase Pin-like site-specific DNA recombinase